jgi:hypothetical protein
MNESDNVDWEAWKAEDPTDHFADRVMAALVKGNPASHSNWTRARLLRHVVLAATIVLIAVVAIAKVTRKAPTQASPRNSRVDQAARGSAFGPEKGPTADSVSAVESAHAERRAAAGSGTIVDRKRRDEVRAKLLPALGAIRWELDPHTGFSVPAGVGPTRNLTKDYIEERIHNDFFPLARACYESALVRLPGLRGRLAIDFLILGDAKVGGIVEQAKIDETSEITDPEFATCMRESMLSMVFDAPENDGWVSVTYPIVFAPGDEAEAMRDQ